MINDYWDFWLQQHSLFDMLRLGCNHVRRKQGNFLDAESKVAGYAWRYSQKAHDAGIRPYITEILEAFRSHMDVQFVATTAGVSAYMA